MCDLVDCRVIMAEAWTDEVFRLKDRKSKEVNITDTKFCLQRVDAV